jgi:nitrate/nitrite transport system ATP-binding protein
MENTMDNTSKFIEIQNAEMVFNTRQGSFHALRDINLNVKKGEFVTLIGHSGCGKSTLLNLIAGLLRASDGTLLCANRRRSIAGARGGVSEPFAAAVADLL